MMEGENYHAEIVVAAPRLLNHAELRRRSHEAALLAEQNAVAERLAIILSLYEKYHTLRSLEVPEDALNETLWSEHDVNLYFESSGHLRPATPAETARAAAAW